MLSVGVCVCGGVVAGLRACSAALVAFYMDVEVAAGVGVTGEASLCGDVCEVGGLRNKLLGAYGMVLGAGAPPSFSVVLPSDNVEGGLVVEHHDLLDATASVKLGVPSAVRQALHVYAAPDLFSVLALTLPALAQACGDEGQEGGLTVVRPARPVDKLALARSLVATDKGGMLIMVECALLQPGTGKAIYTHEAQAGSREEGSGLV